MAVSFVITSFSLPNTRMQENSWLPGSTVIPLIPRVIATTSYNNYLLNGPLVDTRQTLSFNTSTLTECSLFG